MRKLSVIFTALAIVCGAAHAEPLREKRISEAERLAYSGQSNAAFHYLGSMKFYSQAGEAFAKAILDSE